MSGRRRSDRVLRSKLRSPGRPPVARREHRRRFWVLIASGLSSEDAAMGCGISQPVGTRWFREAGGLPPSHLSSSSPSPSDRYLSFSEREEIALLRAQGHGVREVARRLRRAASTISRELRRNAATRSGNLDYRATTAQWHAERAARRPKQAKLAANATLRTYVQDRLGGAIIAPDGAALPGPAVPWKGRRHGPRQHRRWGLAWSPQQIAERLRLDFPGDETMRISHEAIYQALYIQGRGALKRDLIACLRTGRALRVPRSRSARRGKSFITPEVLISERPRTIWRPLLQHSTVDRARHWDGKPPPRLSTRSYDPAMLVLRRPLEPGLRALIRVMQQGIRLAPAPDRHDERICHELSRHTGLHRPAYDAAREQIYDGSDVEPALGGPDISEVGDPFPARDIGREPPVQKIGRGGRPLTLLLRQTPSARPCPQGVLAHDPLDAGQPARDALGQHVAPDAPCTVSAVAGHDARAGLAQDHSVVPCALAGLAGQPCMEAGARDTQRRTHPGDRPDGAMLCNEGERHIASLAK